MLFKDKDKHLGIQNHQSVMMSFPVIRGHDEKCSHSGILLCKYITCIYLTNKMQVATLVERSVVSSTGNKTVQKA